MLSLIQAAGWPIWLLVLASFVAVALIIERSLSLRRERIAPSAFLESVLQARDLGAAGAPQLAELCASCPLGHILGAGLRYERAGPRRMKEAMEEAAHAVAHELGRYLPALGTVASVAPLLGLFGTVIGMIEIFGSQTPSGTSAPQLAHGISVALYNTAFGILVAIPALIAYRQFRARVDDLLAIMERDARQLADRASGTV